MLRPSALEGASGLIGDSSAASKLGLMSGGLATPFGTLIPNSSQAPCSLNQLASPTSENQIVEKSSDPKTSARLVEDKNQHLFRLACLDSPSQSCWVAWKGQRMVLRCYLGMRYVTGGGVLVF